MPITINTNIPSLTAQRNLSNTTSALTKSFERLSSGLRITRASDDAAGLAIAIAALGGTLAQGRAGSAALESISRNPGAYGNLFTPMILVLVFIESLVIFSLLIALKLAGFF